MGVEVMAKEALNPKQELFCQLFASDREFYGNGVDSYAEAYDIDISNPAKYKSAVVAASRLLTKDNILNRINEILEDGGLNDVFVDKQLRFLVTQNADLSTKRAAINDYNKLKQRITDKKHVTVELPKPIMDVTDAIPGDDSNQED
jgi:hypothetical protein